MSFGKYIWALIVLALFTVFACASHRVLTPLEYDHLEKKFGLMLDSKAGEQNNSAYLMQVKVKTPDIKKKFRLEVYFQDDSISFYSPGFLGKGTFKGIIYGDSLRFYLPSEKAYYRGLWYNLTEPDLEYWREVFAFVFDLLKGDFVPDKDSDPAPRKYEISLPEAGTQIRAHASSWDYGFLFNGDKLKNAVYAWARDMLLANFKIKSYGDEFPYFRLDMAKIVYRNDLRRAQKPGIKSFKSEIRIDFIEQKYNLEIPAEKFRLEIPEDAEKIGGLILD